MVSQYIHSGGRINCVGRRWHKRVFIIGLWAIATVRAALVLFLTKSLNYILVCTTLVGLIVLRILQEHLIHISASILKQFASAVEYY